MNLYRSRLSFALIVLILASCDSQSPTKQITDLMILDQSNDFKLEMDMEVIDFRQNDDQDLEIQDMAVLPVGQSFGEVHAIVENSEDSYFFEITESKAVLLETSLDGQGNCPSSLDTILTLYAYQQGARVEPYIAFNDDKDVLAGQFCSLIAQELEPGIYEAVVNGYRKAAIEQYVLNISYPIGAHVGEACDQDHICVNQSACHPVDQKCVSTAPQILSATAYLDRENQSFYLVGTASDFDLDSGILQEVRFLDAQQNLIYQLDPTLLELFKTNEFQFSFTQEIMGIDLSSAVKIQIKLRDFAEHLSESFEVELLDLPVLTLNDSCQIDQFTGKCDPTTLCISPQNDNIGTCIVNHPPVIQNDQSFAYMNDIVLILQINGLDTENNVKRLGVKYFDQNQNPVIVNQLEENLLPIYQQRNAYFYVAQLIFDQYPQISEVEVRLIDTGDLSSAPIRLTIGAQPVIALGDACDAYILENNCGDYVCDVDKDPITNMPLQEYGVCRDIAPTITQAITTRLNNDLLIKVIGTDQAQDITKIGFNAIDAQNQIIPVMNSTAPLYFVPSQIVYSTTNPSEFTASITISNVFTDIPNIASFEIYVLDQTSYQSRLFATQITNRMQLNLGDACDSFRVENICSAGLSCENQQCVVPVLAEIQQAQFFFNQQVASPVLLLKTKITAGSAPIAPKVYFIPKDAQGAIVPLIANANYFILKNPIVDESLGAQVELDFVLDHPLSSQISTMSLWVKDINEIESMHLSINLSADIPVLDQNDICDMNQLLGHCAMNLSCVDQDQNADTAMRCMP
jgi:hypothetical protein